MILLQTDLLMCTNKQGLWGGEGEEGDEGPGGVTAPCEHEELGAWVRRVSEEVASEIRAEIKNGPRHSKPEAPKTRANHRNKEENIQ